jgi:hypothetical protein
VSLNQQVDANGVKISEAFAVSKENIKNNEQTKTRRIDAATLSWWWSF